jgi:hypothetical protein
MKKRAGQGRKTLYTPCASVFIIAGNLSSRDRKSSCFLLSKPSGNEGLAAVHGQESRKEKVFFLIKILSYIIVAKLSFLICVANRAAGKDV